MAMETSSRFGTNDLEGFRSAFSAWSVLGLPQGGHDVKELDELHIDLYEADYRVADDVVPFAEEERFGPNVAVDVMASLRDLQTRALELRNRVRAEDMAYLDEHIGYIDALIRVYEAFLCLGSSACGPC